MSAAAEDREVDRLLVSAGRAVEMIDGAVCAKDDIVPIETNVASLRQLGAVIDGLKQEVHSCGGRDCMGRAIDGLKLWVTRDRLDRATAEARSLAGRVGLLESALREIVASASEGGLPEFALLRDWHEIATRQRNLALQSLSALA